MLDDRDRHLLSLLQRDAEIPVTALAERVSLSVSACSRRIARLREAGSIARAVAILDRRATRATGWRLFAAPWRTSPRSSRCTA